MGMNKTFDNAYLNQQTDNVIKRGYNIYDEWNNKRYSSQKIVASVEGAVELFKKRKNISAVINALAYLFALDVRIKEKYNSLLKCFFYYFAWRRETRAFSYLKSALNIPIGATDVRNVIEVEIKKLVEKLENEWNEEGDDETHGGKRNARADEETLATEEKTQEQELDENSKEITDAEEVEEASEEKTKNNTEQASSEKTVKKDSAQQQIEENISEEAETVNDEKDQVKQEKQNELKEENNVSDDKSEPSTDKKEEAKTYNDAVDFIPPYEENTHERHDEKLSFIDEVIIDNMVKGKEDFIRHNPVDDVKRNNDLDGIADTVAGQNEESKDNGKDDYLYDKMLSIDKGEVQQNEKTEPTQQSVKTESTQQTEKASEIKNEQPKEPIQKNDKESTAQEFKPLSEMLKADTNAVRENDIIKELNNNISKESGEAIYQAQAETMREQLSIASAELGMDAPVEIIGRPETVPPEQSVAGPNRK